MTRRELNGDGGVIELGSGIELRAPGLRGWVELQAEADVRSAGMAPTEIDAALEEAGARVMERVVMEVEPAPAPPATRDVRGPDDLPAVEIRVEDLGDDIGQVVLAVNEGGGASWHFPVDGENALQPATVRGGGGKKIFRIPRTVAGADDVPQGAVRGVGAIIGRKLIRIIAYRVLDPVAGMIAEKFAASWEEKKRPYRVRSFRVDGYRQPEAAPWTETDWRSLSEGPALLFIHGTFSRAHSAFGHLPEETMRELHRRYEERVFAFDHKTLSADPDENVKWLLASMPEGVPIEADVICHSRGGLVSRALATADGPIAVRKLLFVASPNDGTILCDPAHMIQLIDRYTNLATLLAPEVIGDVLEAVITVVKLIGRAGLVKLEGLAAMNRGGAFLRGLASRERDAADYYAIAADYEPEGGALRAIVGGAADLLMDRVFEDASNDLVVPTDGVHTGARSRRFPIDEARRLVLASSSAVHHGGFFSCADVNRKILDWLRP